MGSGTVGNDSERVLVGENRVAFLRFWVRVPVLLAFPDGVAGGGFKAKFAVFTAAGLGVGLAGSWSTRDCNSGRD
jgi:hypothetical protein